MNKKAELTTAQLVGLIVIIVSFVVILILFFRLNLGEQTNKEICHNSVVLKSKTEGFVGSLDCRTDYTCVSGGSDCAGLSSSSNVKVDASNKDAVMKVLADKMSECWWQFGEGKANYLGISDRTGWGTNSCAVCSIIEFDKDVLDQSPKITYREFYNYLAKTQKGDGTYFSYLYGSNDVNKFQNEISYLDIDLDKDIITGSGKYAIITGVKQGAYWGTVTNDIFIYPYYLRSDSATQKLDCNEFITKA
ncbi:MAG: hypothetical protein AABX68_00870 [Nanoarchaeota archaeon]